MIYFFLFLKIQYPPDDLSGSAGAAQPGIVREIRLTKEEFAREATFTYLLVLFVLRKELYRKDGNPIQSNVTAVRFGVWEQSSWADLIKSHYAARR